MTLNLVACSWNVHECVGGDGRRDPARVAAVLDEVSADVYALQEIHSDSRGGGEDDQARFLTEAGRFAAVTGPTLERRGGEYGNLLLTRLPVLAARRHDLSVSGREPRGALEVLLDCPGGRVRVVATHLGLGVRERASQARRLFDKLGAGGPDETLIVLGDWNEWLPWRAALRVARLRFGAFPTPRTFPARRPLLALDRAWVEPRTHLISLTAHRTCLSVHASDHLPLVARLRLQGGKSRHAES